MIRGRAGFFRWPIAFAYSNIADANCVQGFGFDQREAALHNFFADVEMKFDVIEEASA